MAAAEEIRMCKPMFLEAKAFPLQNMKQQNSPHGPWSLAVAKDFFWPNGKRLRVRFLEGTDFVKERVRQYAQEWEQYANIDFRFVESGPAEIRIAFAADDGSWSYIGTENLGIREDAPTMNFGWFNDNTREEEFSRTTIHEFGHALGCIHEHQSPAANIDWNMSKLLDYFAPWSEAMIRQNIISKYDQRAVVNTPFDMNSIMLYFFPASVTRNGVGTPVNTVLSVQDKAFINTIYPFQVRDMGLYSTLDERPWYPPVFLNSKQIKFQPAYNRPPKICVGFNLLDISRDSNMRCRAYADSITTDAFTVHTDSWGDTQLYSAGATWTEVEAMDSSYRMGTFNKLDVPQPGIPGNAISERIDFAPPFETEPEVMVWLSGIDMGKERNIRISAYATDVDNKGFTIHLGAEGDSIFHGGVASWIAYPKGKPGVISGSDDTAYRPSFPAQNLNERKVTFPVGAFDKVPKVIVGVNKLNFDSARNLRIKVYADNIVQDGFTWHADSWLDSLCYGAGVSWIALG